MSTLVTLRQREDESTMDSQHTQEERERSVEQERRWLRLKPDERAIITYQCRAYRPGSFMDAIVTAVFKADPENLEKLRRGFPELVEAYESWTNGNLAERARALGFAV